MVLWGLEESPEAGQLIVAERTKEEAEIVLNQWLAENPQAQERYELDAIQLRYMASVVPVSTLRPKLYLRFNSMAQLDTKLFSVVLSVNVVAYREI